MPCLFVNMPSIFTNEKPFPQIFFDSLLPHLERRGPDHTGRKDFDSKNDHGTYYLSLIGTVLHLRGRKTPQPLIDECGNILLWNGEIFGGLEASYHHTNPMDHCNDQDLSSLMM